MNEKDLEEAAESFARRNWSAKIEDAFKAGAKYAEDKMRELSAEQEKAILSQYINKYPYQSGYNELFTEGARFGIALGRAEALEKLEELRAK